MDLQKVEVLIATTGKDSVEFLKNINLQSAAVIANQADSFSQHLILSPIGPVKFITTSERGVGRNRNIALSNSTADYCVIADDDNIFVNSYVENIVQSFNRYPDADILIFDIISNSARYEKKRIEKAKRVHLWNFCRYGAAQIVIRRKTWIQKPVFFSELYGGGTIYQAGEDVLFLRECIKKRYKIYAIPEILLNVDYGKSTWFRGYNEKFFYDKGALTAALFPLGKKFLIIYFGLKFSKFSHLPMKKILYLMFKGVKGEKTQTSYYEFIDNEDKDNNE